MIKILIFLLVFLGFPSFGKGQACSMKIHDVSIDTCTINPAIRKVPKGSQNIKAILKAARKVCVSEQDKAYFAYAYIASHFLYDENRAKQIGKKKVKRELYINELLSKKKGVCGDFSNYFKLLCDSLGVKCLRVDGYTSGGMFFITPDESIFDHAWNMVSIDGKWMYVDATWAMGDGKSLKSLDKINYDYLFTTENDFDLSHLPADPVYQLSTNKKTFKEFRWREKEFSNQRDSAVYDLIDERYVMSDKDRRFAELKSQLTFSKAPEIAVFSSVVLKIYSLTDKKNPAVKKLKKADYEEAIAWFGELRSYSEELGNRDQKRLEQTIQYEIKECQKKMEKLK